MVNYKKIVVTLLAIASIVAVIIGYWQIEKKTNGKPTRQTEEIR